MCRPLPALLGKLVSASTAGQARVLDVARESHGGLHPALCHPRLDLEENLSGELSEGVSRPQGTGFKPSGVVIRALSVL